MILAIDIGNTRTRLGIFSDELLIRHAEIPTDELEFSEKQLGIFLKKQAIDSTGVSSVVTELNDPLKKILEKKFYLQPVFINGKSALPLKLNIINRNSLGSDRICDAVRGYYYYKRKHNVLIIDCGTAITYDIVLKNGNYEGGAISPGLMTLSRSLNDYTSRLPLLSKQDFIVRNNPVGKHTFDALNSGIVNAFIDSVNGMISRIHRHYKTDFKLILTGGDAQFLMPNLVYKSVLIENCVLEGINIIMKEMHGN